MSNLVRQLIAFDILHQELHEQFSLRNAYAGASDVSVEHVELLKHCALAIEQVLEEHQQTSEFEFNNLSAQVNAEQQIPKKQLLVIHHKLLQWIVSFYNAKAKADDITSDDFSNNAEVRLNLLQNKAAKAKNQISTLANALGNREYAEFLKRYCLQNSLLSQLVNKPS